MRIAIITGSRGDHGALTEVFRALDIAGHQVRWIDVRPGTAVRYPSDAASVAGIACATVAGDLAGFPTDLVLLLGDRYEVAGAALGAYTMGVPIAHLSGGDETQGSLDEGYRHAITKLAHLHFPTNEPAADRIAQMGEDPFRIATVGWPCLDTLARRPLPDQWATLGQLPFGYTPGQRTVLVSLHPDTLGDTPRLIEATSEALKAIATPPYVRIILVGPNNDPGNELIRSAWGALVDYHSKVITYRESFDQETFWALMSHCDVLVGNSSAGYYEAPSMAIPVVDIGDRQRGRIQSSLLVNVPANAMVIRDAINQVLNGQWKPKIPAANPYGDGKACERIVKNLSQIGAEFGDPKGLLRKTWHVPHTVEEATRW